VRADIAIALVIGQDEEDVGLGLGGEQGRRQGQAKRQQGSHVFWNTLTAEQF
jgi:hypothetical protein